MKLTSDGMVLVFGQILRVVRRKRTKLHRLTGDLMLWAQFVQTDRNTKKMPQYLEQHQLQENS